MRVFYTTAVCVLLALSGATALRVETAAPTGVNWVAQGKVTAPKDQALCNASYAFALAANIESAWAIQGNVLSNLSTQEIISCGHSGCNEATGNVAAATSWLLTSNGGKLETSDSYPFTSYHGNVPICNTQNGVVGATIVNSKTLSTSESAIATQVLNHGPVVAQIDDTGLSSYTSGVWANCPTTPTLNHAVLLVGYTEAYWIVKNSRGTSWGEDGYFRLPFGSNACGVANSATTVETTGATLPPTPVPFGTRTPSPPVAPPTPMPPSPPVPETPRPDDHHWTYSPGGNYPPSPSGGNQKYTAYICTDSRCSDCDQKEVYPGECGWQTAWSFKAWCDNSTSTASDDVNLNIYSEAKCGGQYTKKSSYSDYCFSVTATGGIPSGTHMKIKCPYRN